MRYAVGCSFFDKKAGHVEGIFINCVYGDFVCYKNELNISDSRVRIFDTPEYAAAYARSLSASYNMQFSYFAKRLDVARDKFRFYPVKVDSSKFPLKLLQKKSSGGANHVRWQEFSFVTDF